jgi:hypothetical protein
VVIDEAEILFVQEGAPGIADSRCHIVDSALRNAVEKSARRDFRADPSDRGFQGCGAGRDRIPDLFLKRGKPGCDINGIGQRDVKNAMTASGAASAALHRIGESRANRPEPAIDRAEKGGVCPHARVVDHFKAATI